MKSFFGWILKNGWNLFSCVGVFGTFYFSLTYVPDYVKEINLSKITIANESLMDEVQEFIFYDKKISIEDIDSFIRGKELEQKLSYPYTSDEILLQVQDRFMSNQFIPLRKRESIKESIKIIRSTYVPPKKLEENNFNKITVASLLASIIGVLASIFGVYSIIIKIRFDKELEVDLVSSDIKSEKNNSNASSLAMEFEKVVSEVLSDLGVLVNNQIGWRNLGYDFEVVIKEESYIVEVKFYKKLLGLATARDFIYKVNQSGKGGILIVSSGVTERARQFINEHNNLSDNQKIYIVIADTKSKIQSELQKILVV